MGGHGPFRGLEAPLALGASVERALVFRKRRVTSVAVASARLASRTSRIRQVSRYLVFSTTVLNSVCLQRSAAHFVNGRRIDSNDISDSGVWRMRRRPVARGGLHIFILENFDLQRKAISDAAPR